MNTQVLIQLNIIGYHNYPNAPKVVEFLKNPHRHTFVIKAGFRVKLLDREKEIFILSDKVVDFLRDKFGYPCEFKNRSCEMIATEILEHFQYEEDMQWCEVCEEQTGGARVEV